MLIATVAREKQLNVLQSTKRFMGFREARKKLRKILFLQNYVASVVGVFGMKNRCFFLLNSQRFIVFNVLEAVACQHPFLCAEVVVYRMRLVLTLELLLACTDGHSQQIASILIPFVISLLVRSILL